MEAPNQANMIIMSARFLVLRRKYLRGDVIDQYRSSDKMDKLKIDAVDAV